MGEGEVKSLQVKYLLPGLGFRVQKLEFKRVFVGLSAVCIGIAKFIAWLFSFQWWVYLIALIVIVGVVVLTHFLKHRHSKKKYNTETKPSDEAKVEVAAVETKTDRDRCPRCGGLLVKRHGPYGDFYGCENFGGDSGRNHTFD